MKKIKKNLTNKVNIKIIRLYIVGLTCIAFYFYLENSKIISDIVKFADKGRYSGFPTFLLTGLFKYGLLVVGIGILIMVTIQLIRNRIKKD